MSDLDPNFFASQLLYECARRNRPGIQQSELLLLSTFQELEPIAVRELKRLLKTLAGNDNNPVVTQVMTVGPTISFRF